MWTADSSLLIPMLAVRGVGKQRKNGSVARTSFHHRLESRSEAKKELLREQGFNNLWLGRKESPSKKVLRLEPKYVMLVLY